MKVRLKYAAIGGFAFLSQLDLGRAIERSFRRANFKLSFSKGFNPRPIFAFGPAKATGFDSFHEILDVKFETEVDLKDLIQKLNDKTPSGLIFLSAREIGDDEFGNATKKCRYADYLLVFKKTPFTESLASIVRKAITGFEPTNSEGEAFLLSLEVKNKKEAVRELILSDVNDKILSERLIVKYIDIFEGENEESLFLKIRTILSAEKTVRPEKLLNTLAMERLNANIFEEGAIERIIRLGLLTFDGGELVELR